MADNTRRNGIKDAAAIIRKRSRQNLLTGCMEWQGTVSSKGYGYIRCDSKMKKVYRVIYEDVFGPISPGMHVLHHCDNPSCVEPIHLFLGTNKDNIADKVMKDRASKKLTAEKAIDAFFMCKSGKSYSEVADMFGVAQSTISRIVSAQRRPNLLGRA